MLRLASGATNASSHGKRGRMWAKIARCGAFCSSFSQLRIRGLPAFATTAMGMPVSGSRSATKKEW